MNITLVINDRQLILTIIQSEKQPTTCGFGELLYYFNIFKFQLSTVIQGIRGIILVFSNF